MTPEDAQKRKLWMSYLRYDPDSAKGDLIWKVNKGPTARIGDVAGNLDKDGYRVIKINGKTEKAHRIIFLFMAGYMPEEVDHFNGDKSDNRWNNLLPSNSSANQKNQGIPSNNTSGVIGVRRQKATKKWRSKIMVDGVNIHLGLFDDLEAAAEARRLADIKYGFSPTHGDDK